MFDCLEEDFNEDREFVFLIKQRRNKKDRKHNIIFLSRVKYDGSLEFKRGLENAKMINLRDYYYEHIKNTVRIKGIHCSLYRITKTQYYSLFYPTSVSEKPVKKETWWGLIKVWFFRKFWIPIGK